MVSGRPSREVESLACGSDAEIDSAPSGRLAAHGWVTQLRSASHRTVGVTRRGPALSCEAEISSVSVSPLRSFVVTEMPAVRPASTGAGAARTGTVVAAVAARPRVVIRALRMVAPGITPGKRTTRGRRDGSAGSPEPFAELLRLRGDRGLGGGVPVVAQVGPIELTAAPARRDAEALGGEAFAALYREHAADAG